MRRILIPLVIVALVGYVALMVVYEIVGVDIVSFMEDQPSIIIKRGRVACRRRIRYPFLTPLISASCRMRSTLCLPMGSPCSGEKRCMGSTVRCVTASRVRETDQ